MATTPTLPAGASSPPARSALAKLFVGPGALRDIAWFSLPGGRTLYVAGDEADTLYFLKSGRLGVIRAGAGDSRFLGVIKPGEPAGEMALIAGTAHTATVLAMRDCEILAMPRDAFLAAARRDPALMSEIVRLTVTRAQQAAPRVGSGAPAVFAFIGLSPGAPIRPIVEQIAAELTRLGLTSCVLGAESLSRPIEWFSTLEQAHERVLFVAERNEEAFARLASRQADRIMLVGRGEQPAPPAPAAVADAALGENRLMDLILLQPPSRSRPQGSAAWLEQTRASRLFHVRDGLGEDCRRLARILAGASVGLVLSGGGARAYAHIGVIRALREAGEPIDFIGGASMGAIIGAGAAMGWPDVEIEERIRAAFVTSSPLADIALPVIAMTKGRLVEDRLREHFGDTLIEDLWRPFFCVSSNLTHGAVHLHQKGSLRLALRASSSLPGVMPPVIWEDGSVLVDGAVTNNLPSDVMRRWQRGPVVGVDVATAKALTAEDVRRPPSLMAWFLSGDWRKGSPVVSLLIRAATVSGVRGPSALEGSCDLMIAPEIEGVELRDWKAFAPAVESGYRSTIAALESLDRPLIDLCRGGVAERSAAG
jgi:NTE family protein